MYWHIAYVIQLNYCDYIVYHGNQDMHNDKRCYKTSKNMDHPIEIECMFNLSNHSVRYKAISVF